MHGNFIHGKRCSYDQSFGHALCSWSCRVPNTSLSWWHCHPEIFCVSGKFLRIFTKLPIKCSRNINWRENKCGNFPDCLESFKTVWKVSRQPGKFLDSDESFQTVTKVSGQSEKFPDSVESFRTVWKDLDSLKNVQTMGKVSRQCGKFPDSLESSGQSENCSDSLETFQTVR